MAVEIAVVKLRTEQGANGLCRLANSIPGSKDSDFEVTYR